MIVLDTNVISGLMRSQPDPGVTAWIAGQPRGTLYTTCVNEAEILYGIRAMPEGRRRSGLMAGAEALFAEEFAGRVLPFDGAAARRYAEIVVLRRRTGKPIEAFDALIAATAWVAGAAIATRCRRIRCLRSDRYQSVGQAMSELLRNRREAGPLGSGGHLRQAIAAASTKL